MNRVILRRVGFPMATVGALVLFLTTFMGPEYAAVWFATHLVAVFAISMAAERILPKKRDGPDL